jgi:cytoskeletal protein RodZ
VTDEVHKLGEVLRAAREAKGVDIGRVERETKIRERYLSALERGDYGDLPGSVYTKGFLRNYGTYLGLDPEYLIDLYRLETSTPVTERPRMPVPPRPLATRGSRAFVVTPGVIAAAILTVLVGGFVAYLGYEIVNFARMPELRITEPAGNVNAWTELTITVRGTTAPNARVTVANLPENPTVLADASGDFVMTVGLRPGSNVMRLTARDPVTGRDSEVEERTVIVVSQASPSPAESLTASEPGDGATAAPGGVAVAGTAAPGAAIELGAELVTPPELAFTVTTASGAPVTLAPPPPPPPSPVSLTADSTGAFSGHLALAAGTWDLTIRADDAASITRRVTVEVASGLRAFLIVDGGESYIVLEEDGRPVEGQTGRIAADGERIGLGATGALRIRVGNAGAVRIAINGIALGRMGDDGEVVEWRVTRREG